jgi:hypothetical protein
MPQDYGKKARFSDRHPHNEWTISKHEWTISKLSGYCNDTAYTWVADNGSRWTFCEVED